MQPSKSLVFPMLLVVYEIATYLSNDMYLPAVPAMMRELSLTTAQVQSTLTIWFMGLASMPLMIGIIADRFGRRPVLLAGGLIYILANMVCALTSDLFIVMIARFIQGSMAATMMVAGYACVHELYEHKEAVRMLALMGSISILAPALGPLFGSFILFYFNWRAIFWVIAILSAIAISLLYQWMPETLSKNQRQKIQVVPLIQSYLRVITNKNFMILMTVLGFIFCGFIVWITAGPLLIIDNFHQTAVTFGLIQAGIFIAYIIGSHGVKYFIEDMAISRVITIGLGITLSGGLLLLGATLVWPLSLAPFLAGMTIYSFGAALCFAPLNRSIIDTSDEPMGVRVAFFTVFFTGFAALGSGLASLYFNGTIISVAVLISGSIVLSVIAKKFY